MVNGMADDNRLNWLHTSDPSTSDLWQSTIMDSDNPDSPPWGPRGAVYQIRQYGSPPVFELRWLWHSGGSVQDMMRNEYKLYFDEPGMVRQFESLARAMEDAEGIEQVRRNPPAAPPPAVLEGIRIQSAPDYNGDEYVIVDDREADMAGWKLETISRDGIRRLEKFSRHIPWGGRESRKFYCALDDEDLCYPWSAYCDLVSIVRWVPPVTTTNRADMLKLVKERHAHQIRNGKAKTPYWEHCKGAADILEEAIAEHRDITDSTVVENMYLAALGHDLYEDGKPEVKPEDIAPGYGKAVADLIAEVTNRKDDTDRNEYLEQLRTASDEAILIKYADQIDNAESIYAHLNDFEPGESIRYVRMLEKNFAVLDAYQFDYQWSAIGQVLRDRLAETWPQLMARKYTIKGWGEVFDDETDAFDHASKFGRLADLLLKSDWYQSQGSDAAERAESALGRAIQDLRNVSTVTDGNKALRTIYDLAGEQGAWMEPAPATTPDPDNPKRREAVLQWKYAIKGWGDTIASPGNNSQKYHRLVDLIQQSDWYRDQGSDDAEREKSDLGQALQALGDAPDINTAQAAIDVIYALADDQLAWLYPAGWVDQK